jgi:hypothetical protein
MLETSYPQRRSPDDGSCYTLLAALAPRQPEILDPDLLADWNAHGEEERTCRHLWALEAGILRCYHCHWRYAPVREKIRRLTHVS